MDRERIIKGLHCCSHTDGINCLQCPYDNTSEDCTALMAMDVLELLKEQEAKQGKWERQYSRPGVYANLFWWCSVCGEPTRYNDAGIFYQYCPHCGAKLEACKET